MLARSIAVIVSLVVAGFALPAFAAGERIALVLGNGAYLHAPELPNPPNDARAITAKLEELGFEVVSGYDLGIDEMRETIRSFASRLTGADVALFFYAGHGMQVFGENYLIPVDANLSDETDLDFSAVKINLVLRQMEREPRVKLIILDACRDNPFEQTLSRSMGKTRSSQALSRGLAEIDTGGGTLIAFATDPGRVALDGEKNHSPFTEALLEHMDAPGLDIGLVMRRVTRSVKEATNDRQSPWVNVSLDGEFYLNPASAPAPSSDAPAPPPVPSFDDRQIELALWQSAERSGSRADYEEYLRQYPTGKFAGLARNRLVEDEQGDEKQVAVVDPEQTRTSVDRTESRDEADERALALSTSDRREIQRRLTLLGYDTRGVDGIFGPGTRRAVGAWQRSRGYATSGYLNRPQYDQLLAQTNAAYDRWVSAQAARRQMRPVEPAPSQVPAQRVQTTQPAPVTQPRQPQQQPGFGAREAVEGVKAFRDIFRAFQ